MFTGMGTLDHAIHELIIAHLKRPGLSGRRFGVETFDGPGFAASLKRRRRTSPANRPVGADHGSCAAACVCRCSRFVGWTIQRIANSSIPEPSRCCSNAPRLSRAEDGTGMGKTRNGCLTTEQAVHPGSSPRTPERCRVRRGVPACVSCCDRVHARRDDLDGRIADDGRPAAAGSDDDCRRDGQKIAIGENKFVVAPQRRGAYACHPRSSQECQKTVITQ